MKLLQGFLDTKTPLLIGLAANFLNFCLDPILIFKLGMYVDRHGLEHLSKSSVEKRPSHRCDLIATASRDLSRRIFRVLFVSCFGSRPLP